jgi:uncharacterized protein (DUF885 family)
MFKKNRVSAFVLTAVILAASFAGCTDGNASAPAEEGASFDTFTDELFRHYVSSDSIALNSLLVHPENYGIEKLSPTFGDYGTEAFSAEADYSDEKLNELQEFDYDQLSYEQRLTYDVLSEFLTEGRDSAKFLYYKNVLSPIVGMQVELPVLLDEYRIDEKEDLDYYLELLEELPGYFEEVIAFEREKKEHGTFMSKDSAEGVINQIGDFIADPEANLLINSFDRKIDSFGGLTDEERADFKARGKAVVLESVVPAYRSLADSLAELNVGNSREGGLSSIDGGKEYYEYLVRVSSSSQRSVDELESMVDNAIEQAMDTYTTLYNEDPAVSDEMENPTYPDLEPEEILDYLRDIITEDFPAPVDDGYELKYVDESLEEFISPAFYLTPPIDDPDRNVIYLNNRYMYDRREMFPVMVHEGYPGHLYQIVYFYKLDRALIRKLLASDGYNDGYAEGWAVYVERPAYRYAGLEENVAVALSADETLSALVNTKIDIAVNYRGWRLEDASAYLAQFGMTNERVAKAIYDDVVADPTYYVKYMIGYIEIIDLEKKAQELWGDDFSEMKFHEFLLETGPAPFSVVDDRLSLWSVEGAGEEEKAAA